MKSSSIKLSVILVMLYPLAIEIVKSKRCHKQPNPVKCLNRPSLSCGSWSMNIAIHNITVGSIGRLTCPADHSLRGNDTIWCLESGLWSRIKATCVPDDVTEPYFLLFGGSRYYFVKAELQTYPQAKATCLDICATLVEINNEAENNFIILNAERLGQVSPWIGLESKDGTSYEWASGNTTESNLYDNWSNTNTIIYGVGRCVFMNVSNKEWLSKAQSTCNSVKDEFICEFLDLINNHDKT